MIFQHLKRQDANPIIRIALPIDRRFQSVLGTYFWSEIDFQRFPMKFRWKNMKKLIFRWPQNRTFRPFFDPGTPLLNWCAILRSQKGPKKWPKREKVYFQVTRRRDQKMYRKIDENVVVSAREIINSIQGFPLYFENRPFQKSPPKTMPKDLQNHAQIVPQFQKCLKKGGPKKGSKTGLQKVNFFSTPDAFPTSWISACRSQSN